MLNPLVVITDRLNAAVDHYNADRHEQALAAYEAAFDPVGDVRLQVPPKLRAEVDARKLDVLVAMERWEAARALIGTIPEPRIHLDGAQLYSFHLAAGRVEAAGNSIDGLLQAYSEAIRVADEHLHDRDKLHRAENELLSALCKKELWPTLLETARSFVAMGQEVGDDVMVMLASQWIPYALRGLGDKERARSHASQILAFARRHCAEEMIRECEEFLASLE